MTIQLSTQVTARYMNDANGGGGTGLQNNCTFHALPDEQAAVRATRDIKAGDELLVCRCGIQLMAVYSAVRAGGLWRQLLAVEKSHLPSRSSDQTTGLNCGPTDCNSADRPGADRWPHPPQARLLSLLMSCSPAGSRDGQVGVVALALCEELLQVATEHSGLHRSKLGVRCALMHDTASSSQDLMALASAGSTKHPQTVLSAVVALEEPRGSCTCTGSLHWLAVTGRGVADCQLLVLGGEGAFSAHEWSSGDAMVMMGQHTEHYWWVVQPRHNLPLHIAPPLLSTCLSTPQTFKDASSDI